MDHRLTPGAPKAGGGWRTAAASVRGVAHQRLELPCQDAHACREMADGALLIVVADGAGSAAHAEDGSHIAVEAAMESVRNAPGDGPGAEPEAVLREALEAAHRRIVEEAQEWSLDPHEFATTLILVRATGDGAMAAQVGDGAAVTMDEDGEMTALTRPQNGEYLNTTTFLTSADWRDSIVIARSERPLQGVAAFSDGLEMIALGMPDGDPHVPFFRPLFQFAAATESEVAGREGLEAFLNSPRVAGRADDDLTLVVCARAPQTPAAADDE